MRRCGFQSLLPEREVNYVITQGDTFKISFLNYLLNFRTAAVRGNTDMINETFFFGLQGPFVRTAGGNNLFILFKVEDAPHVKKVDFVHAHDFQGFFQTSPDGVGSGVTAETAFSRDIKRVRHILEVQTENFFTAAVTVKGGGIKIVYS